MTYKHINFPKTSPINFSEEDKEYIESRTWTSADWDNCKDAELVNIKAKIKQSLEPIQNGYCAYCGFQYGSPDIEHIVPKANNIEQMFEPLNLVLSCVICNRLNKRNRRTIKSKSKNYSDWDFLIVHPYLDDYSTHIDDSDAFLQFKTQKGDYHINTVFRLNNEPFLGQRVQAKFIEKLGLSAEYEAEYNSIITSHYSTE